MKKNLIYFYVLNELDLGAVRARRRGGSGGGGITGQVVGNGHSYKWYVRNDQVHTHTHKPDTHTHTGRTWTLRSCHVAYT